MSGALCSGGTDNVVTVGTVTIGAGVASIGTVGLDAGVNYIGRVRVTDGVTNTLLAAFVASIGTTASGGNILAAAGVGVRHRIFLLTISVDTAGLVTISDGVGAAYMAANSSFTFDFQHIGLLQTTAATAITCTNAGGGNFTAHVTYLDV
jgi:hypothetical protein